MLLFRNLLLIGLMLFSMIGSHVLAQNKQQNHASKADKPLIFGVAPFMSPVALVKRLSPLRDYLSKTLNHTVHIETTKSAKENIQTTLSRHHDLVLTSPTFALELVDSGMYDLQLTQTRPLSGLLVVLDNSPVKNVSELAGKKIGSPPANGFLGILSHKYLESLGLKDKKAVRVEHFYSHNDAISALRLGNVDASFIASFMKKHLAKQKLKVRILARSDDYPGLSILTSRNLKNDLATRITDALLKLDKTKEGKNF